jgi:putative flippase GtrA
MKGLRIRSLAGEGARYMLASGFALAVDLGTYSALIRLAGVHYLLAAPVGFALGLLIVYFASVRWVFPVRRIADARLEFAVFAAVGLLGMAANEAIIYAAVEHGRLAYEAAKLVSAAIVFWLNFTLRKLLLFTRFGARAP